MTVLDSFNPLHCGAVVASWWAAFAHLLIACGFNPLHCGAVVASPPFGGGPIMDGAFQSPSLRGSGRFLAALALRQAARGHDVSIPFIAGQWSLRPHAPVLLKPGVAFQSPSLRGSGRFAASGSKPTANRSFNPLHCGAVVASGSFQPLRWMDPLFQSPSLRGSGRFAWQWCHYPKCVSSFQSPSLRGSGRFD